MIQRCIESYFNLFFLVQALLMFLLLFKTLQVSK